MQQQSLQATSIIISCTSNDDIIGIQIEPHIPIIFGEPGLTRQRNAILDAVHGDMDIIVFFDDDFLPHKDYLSVINYTFKRYPNIAAITGNVIADGGSNRGIAFEEAQRLVSAPAIEQPWILYDYSPYGCNMAFRLSVIGKLRFDERLVLYGWLEDLDFGARIAKTGNRLVKIESACGVHMGSKTGRTSGRRLGYSQVVNPFYIFRKGGMTTGAMMTRISRNLAMNAIFSLAPEPWVDRRSRLYGNLLAIIDLCRGRVTPERTASL